MSLKAIKAGRIVTMSEQGEIENGILLYEDGRIRQVGKKDAVEIPSDAQVVDCSDKVLLPGLIDAHTHVGIHEEGEGWEGQDTNEMTDPLTPQVRGIDGINGADIGLQDAVSAGVTTVNAGPGSANVIGGKFVALKTAGSIIVDDLVLKEPTAMKMAMGENPKRVYNEKDKIPSTRVGVASVLRKALFEAKDYLERKESAVEEDKNFTRDFQKEALIPVIQGELRAKIHAHRADDIVTAVRVAEEFDLRYSIDHCTEGHKVVDFLVKHGVDSIVGPSLSGRSKRELVERTFKTPCLLSEAGVQVAITTDSPVVPIQYLPLMAAFAVREGMEKKDALRAITINSARIADIDDRVGSLEEGKDADFIVSDGLPFTIENKVERVFIEGKEIDLETLPRRGKVRIY